MLMAENPNPNPGLLGNMETQIMLYKRRSSSTNRIKRREEIRRASPLIKVEDIEEGIGKRSQRVNKRVISEKGSIKSFKLRKKLFSRPKLPFSSFNKRMNNLMIVIQMKEMERDQYYDKVKDKVCNYFDEKLNDLNRLKKRLKTKSKFEELLNEE